MDWLKVISITSLLLAITFRVHIVNSEGVQLIIKGAAITNNGYVDVADIGEGNDALLCHTDKADCCTNMMGRTRAGEWYFLGNEDNIMRVETLGIPPRNDTFYRDRHISVVRLNRRGSPQERGLFRCEVPDTNNVNQMLSVNIVDIGEVTISPTSSMNSVAGENLILECSSNVNPLPENLTPPSFDWLFGPSNASLPADVIPMATMLGSNTYISTVQFSPLSQSHAGMYTCRLGGNERLAAIATVTVNVPAITIQITANKIPVVGQVGYTLTCKIIGANNLNPDITYHWIKNNGIDSETQIGNNSNTLFFHLLRYSDAGLYGCQVDIESTYLNGPISFNSSRNISIHGFINNPIGLSVNRGDEVNLNCSFSLDQSKVNISWNTPADIWLTPMDQTDTGINVTQSALMFTAMNSSYAGDYFCTAYVDGFAVNSIVGVLSLNYISVEFTMTEYTVTEGEDLNINISVMVNGALSRNVTICLDFQDGTDKAQEFNVDTSDSAVMTLQIPFNELPLSRDIIMFKLKTVDNLVELGSNVTMHITVIRTVSPVTTLPEAQQFIVDVTQVGNQVAGENYALICSMVPKFNTTVYEWLYQDDTADAKTIIDSSNNWKLSNQSFNSELLFSPLLESHTGTYTCQASLGSNMNESSHVVNVMVPTIEVEIDSNGISQLGENFNLTCTVLGAGKLHPNTVYRWTKNSTDDIINTQIIDSFSTLFFHPLNYSDTGLYTCQVEINSTYLNSIITFNTSQNLSIQIPNIEVIINSSRGNLLYMLGEDYNLTCTVMGADKLNPMISYEWTRTQNEDQLEMVDNKNNVYSFPAFRFSDAGNYSCMVNINSNYIEDIIMVTSDIETLLIQLPATDSVIVMSVPVSPIHPAVSAVTLTCTVELSPAVDVPVTVTTMWTGPAGFMTTNTAQPVMGTTTTYTSTAVVNSFGRHRSGKYTCTATVSSTSSFLLDSESHLAMINVNLPEGVYLSLRKLVYPNNSVIFIKDIGETNTPMSPPNSGLQCITDMMPCCKTPNIVGEWYYPNGTPVPIQNNAATFYRNRGDDGTVNLNRLNDGVMSPTGMYCCEIPNAAGMDTSLCISIVDVKITTSDNNTAGEIFTLKCELSGVPENVDVTYIWLRNDTAINTTSDGTITVSMTSPSISQLTFNPLQISHEGVFSCQVMTEGITDKESFNITVNVLAISINIDESGDLALQQNLTLTCTVSGHEKLANPIITYMWSKDDDILIPDSANNNTLFFLSLRLLDAAEYKCAVTVTSDYLNNEIIASENYILQLTVPSPEAVNVTSPSDTIIAGSSLNLECTVQFNREVDSSLIVNITWSGPEKAVFVPTDHVMMVNFTMYTTTAMIKAAISGNYCCEVTVTSSSSFFIGSEMALGHLIIDVDPLPSPTDLMASALSTQSINLTWEQPLGGDIVDYYEINYNFTINECIGTVDGYGSGTVMINDSSTRSYSITNGASTPVEEDSIYCITLTAVNSIERSEGISTETSTHQTVPEGAPDIVSVMEVNSTTIEITWGEVGCTQRNGNITGYRVTYGNSELEEEVINVTDQYTLVVNGLYPLKPYTFKVAAINNQGIGPYNINSTQTGSPNRIFAFLDGVVFANNSIVTEDEIGSGDSHALLCYTNLPDCCRSIDKERGALGEWYGPVGEKVPKMYDAISKDFSAYRNRGPSVVRLHRVINKTLPNGIFQCEVNDANGSLQSVYIGVYSESKGHPSVTSLEYIGAEELNTPYFICTSTGGPPTTVTWRRNGQPLVIDGIIYQQSQRVINTTTATYANILSSRNANANLVGSFTCIVSNARGSASESISTSGVAIVGDFEFKLGSSATVLCKSDTPTISMMWLSENKVLVSENSTQQLGLTFTPVNDTVHGKEYTCIVERMNKTHHTIMVEQSFTLNATVPSNILDITIHSNGTAIAGSTYEITCEVKKEIDGLFNSPDATWTVGGRERDTNSSGTSTSLLRFSPLKTSHAGNYTCWGTVFSLARPEEPYSIMKTHRLTVQIPTPKVVVSLPDYTLFAGTTVSVTCRINLSESVDSVSLHVDWFNGSYLTSNDTDRVSISLLSGVKPSYTSILTISPLSDRENISKLTCRASATNLIDMTTSGTGENSTILYVVQRAPSAPNIMVGEITNTSTSIYVAWSQLSDDFIKGFTITANYTGPCRTFINVTTIQYLVPSLTENPDVNITGLHEYSNYSIMITAFNDADTNFSRVENIQTKPSAPDGPPTDIKNVSVNLTSMTISWDSITCLRRNSAIRNYIIKYKSDHCNRSSNTTKTTITLYKLDPSTEYVVEIQAENENNMKSPLSIPINVTTNVPKVVEFLLRDHHYSNNEIVPLTEVGEKSDALLCLTNSTKIESSMMGEWYFPDSSRVPLNGLDSGIYSTRGPSAVSLNRKNDTMMPTGVYRCVVPDANESNQSIYIGVYSSKEGDGIVMVKELNFDEENQTLSCISTGGPPTTVSWMKDDHPIIANGTTYWQTQTIVNQSSSTYATILYVGPREPDQVIGNYTCKVENSRVTSHSTNQYIMLEIQGIRITGHESNLLHGSLAALNCTTDLAVSMIQWLDMKGRMIKNGTNSLLELTDIPTEASDLEYTCKVVGKFGNQTKTVTLNISPEAVSSELVPGAASAAISVIAVLVIVLLAAFVVIIIVRRKHQGKLTLFPGRVKNKPRSTFVIHATPLHGGLDDTSTSDKDEKLEMKTLGKAYIGRVVSIPNFGAHVIKMHEGRDELFEMEYLSISKEPQKSHAVADIVVNKLRNRFGNIFPYDHCQVKLKQIAGAENSDYINASYIDGYQKPSAYVAAQGPLPNTLADFWRMVWEKRLTTIVMLTQCFEGRKKCECYWPEYISDTFEPGQGITVVLNSMTPFSEYTVRKMIVTQSSEPQLPPLEVNQFHFVAWPDHGVPDNCAVMLNFIRRVRKLHPYSNPCPLLVHCSAGVGRTGTLIVLDTMIERMKTEDTLNVYDFVKQLREQRVLMVQTLSQYMFIHDALKEYIICGQTEISAADIRKVIEELSVQHDPCSASTGFEHQFQTLGQLPYVTEENCYSNATLDENIVKNRYSNKLPNNFYCVRLKSTATPGSDYINASFIDGYRQKNTYIATQGPLESTVCDFWRMVWEKESKCVVLLCQLRENDKETCYCYWPTTEGDTKTYGQITVTLLTEERYGYCDLRKFEINEDKTSHPGVEGVKTGFTVTQFHFLEWPEHETPPITSSLIELMGNVNKVQMGAGNKPMIVMCNDGVGRTGTFICIHAQLERLKTEGVFDFFQFIKSARMQRAGLVSDSVQYVLCHEVLADYLESFDTYANFKEVM